MVLQQLGHLQQESKQCLDYFLKSKHLVKISVRIRVEIWDLELEDRYLD